MAEARLQVSVRDLPVFREWLERVRDFIQEYAHHDRSCAAVDADGQWRQGNPDCTCGYEESLTGLIPSAAGEEDTANG